MNGRFALLNVAISLFLFPLSFVDTPWHGVSLTRKPVTEVRFSSFTDYIRVEARIARTVPLVDPDTSRQTVERSPSGTVKSARSRSPAADEAIGVKIGFWHRGVAGIPATARKTLP
ncbi:MAG: hypothetical protein JW863_01225 [Chitinispirillaceae bacterium]|nr:hypothetical protein [Chitinispirillaceae bacterium]